MLRKFLWHRAGWAVAWMVAVPIWSVSAGEGGTSPPPAAPPQSGATQSPAVADRWELIQRDYQKAQQDFSTAYQNAKTDAERQEVASHYPDAKPFVARAMASAERNPEGPDAMPALAFVLQLTQRPIRDLHDARARAVELLRQHQMNNPNLTEVFVPLRNSYFAFKPGEDLLRDAAEHSPHRDVRAKATMALAGYLRNLSETARVLHDQPQAREQVARSWGEDVVQAMPTDAAKLVEEVRSLYQRVIDQYGDVSGPSGMLAEQAKSTLYAVDHLAIGKVAPDIVGKDVDGKPLRLADYRGKVVVLDFWGDW